MNNLDSIVSIFFKKVSARNILTGELPYDNFPEDDFIRLTLQELPHLSKSEIVNIYGCLCGQNSWQGKGLNIFSLLKRVTEELLYIRNDEPVCRYSELMRWRMLVKNIGEDFPVCAYLASRTEKTGYIWNDFEWNVVLNQDNIQLNSILQKGISENHFHLYGSSPAFALSWINLMNHLTNHQYASALYYIERNKQVNRMHYSPQYEEDSLEMMHFQAALIRAVLYMYIDMARTGNRDGLEEIVRNRKRIERVLTDASFLFFYKKEVQLLIDSLRMAPLLKYHTDWTDYAVMGYEGRSINHDFEGERAILYSMLVGEINHVPVPDFLMRWFYAYLVIKGKLYEELVQVNDAIGFANFSQYSKKKGLFLQAPGDRRKMVQHAVGSSFRSGNMRSLEMRIIPGRTVQANKNEIQRIDRYIEECHSKEILQRTYYVLHFPKRREEKLEVQYGFVITCRHAAYRKQLERVANVLIQFREMEPQQAARVLGIDACSQEIGCRPEVFGPVYRWLTDHVIPRPNIYGVRQWKATYHVGEDFLDLADGLRAIEETVLFLNMKYGDRLGHATALGLDVKKWYAYKFNSISIPIQDYLDNVVWLYHKILEFNIQSCETLKGFLRNEYEKYFYEIYEQFMDREVIRDIVKSRDKCGSAVGKSSQGENVDYFRFDIHTYYEAWMLRGDDPSLYREGLYWNPHPQLQEYKVNHNIREGDIIRGSAEANILLFYYHYSAETRHAGAAFRMIELPDIYVDGVEKVQRALQQYIADRGISIETNPSSNYLISTMEKYEDHPIRNMFNMGMEICKSGEKQCPQLHVSVNTDDKGIFYTSLENEYALLGIAMENVRDDAGNKIYQRQMVMDWLDHIREQGNQQSFSQLCSRD